MISREPLYSAFFSVVSTAVQTIGAVTVSRRFRLFTDVPPVEQPALFQVQGKETPYEQRGQPTRWYLPVRLYVYVHVGDDPNALQSPVLNAFADAIEGAFPLNRASGYQYLSVPWESQGGTGAYNICWENFEHIEDVLDVTGQGVLVVDARITTA
jgi:hypothetical protein